MTLEQNITAILETYFSGFRSELVEACVKRIMEQIERQADTPQADCGDFADRLAYERGVKHAWEVAQKVFDSTVTFYEAEDVAKQIADTPQTDLSAEEFVERMKNLKMEVKRTDCDRYAIVNDEGERAYNCIGCQTDCAWK